MTPLLVRARVSGSVMVNGDGIALDALLMAAVALRDNLPPLGFGERAEIAIPLAEERGVYLASLGQYAIEEHERRWINRRFPMAEAQSLGGAKMKRVNTSAGPSKGYRFPVEAQHLRDDTMIWYARGDADAVRELLSWITYLGKKRSVGLGRVLGWDVEACEPWDGFPVLREGRPLRPLPLDWPGLGAHRVESRVLAPPYWERWRAEACAVS